jgi:hypothetical protein
LSLLPEWPDLIRFVRPVNLPPESPNGHHNVTNSMVHRLISYIHHSLDLCLLGWIADPVGQLELTPYTDADFAGDPDTMKSTSGVLMRLRGPHSFVPLAATSKRQTCASHSIPEAEIVAAALGIGHGQHHAWMVFGLLMEQIGMEHVCIDDEATRKVVRTHRENSYQEHRRVLPWTCGW